MKLNNKGMTIVEVLVCFVIVSVVMMSLFSTISSFNEKRIQESYRAKIYTYKNEWTSRIQEDFIRKGLSFAKITRAAFENGVKYTVYCTLKTGEKRELVVYQKFTYTKNRLDGTAGNLEVKNEDGTIIKESKIVNDQFYLEYGEPGSLYHEDLPELGTVNWYCLPEDLRNCKVVEPNANNITGISHDLQINNIHIEITNEGDQTSSAHVLSIYIGFTHPNFGTRYAIDIVAPIDYQGSNIDTSKFFPTATDESEKETKILEIPQGDHADH